MTETKLVATYVAESSTPVIVVPPTFVGANQTPEQAMATLEAQLAALPPAQWVQEWVIHPGPHENRELVAEREVRWPTVDGGPLVIGKQQVRYVLIPVKASTKSPAPLVNPKREVAA